MCRNYFLQSVLLIFYFYGSYFKFKWNALRLLKALFHEKQLGNKYIWQHLFNYKWKKHTDCTNLKQHRFSQMNTCQLSCFLLFWGCINLRCVSFFPFFSQIIKLPDSVTPIGKWEDICRSNQSQTFFKIVALENFAKLTGKHLCWSLFLIKLKKESLCLTDII